jgi:hypothetical protein
VFVIVVVVVVVVVVFCQYGEQTALPALIDCVVANMHILAALLSLSRQIQQGG